MNTMPRSPYMRQLENIQMNANLKLSDLMIKENMTMCWRGYISVWNIYMILYFSLVQNDCSQYYNQVVWQMMTCKSKG